MCVAYLLCFTYTVHNFSAVSCTANKFSDTVILLQLQELIRWNSFEYVPDYPSVHIVVLYARVVYNNVNQLQNYKIIVHVCLYFKHSVHVIWWILYSTISTLIPNSIYEYIARTHRHDGIVYQECRNCEISQLILNLLAHNNGSVDLQGVMQPRTANTYTV